MISFQRHYYFKGSSAEIHLGIQNNFRSTPCKVLETVCTLSARRAARGAGGGVHTVRPPGASDPTVIGSVLQLPRQSEECGERGHGYVEDQLPRIPQAEQVEVAQHDGGQQGEGLVFLPRRVEKVEVALRWEKLASERAATFPSGLQLCSCRRPAYLKYAADESYEKRHNVPHTIVIILHTGKKQIESRDDEQTMCSLVKKKRKKRNHDCSL